MSKRKSDGESGFRLIRESGNIELPQQKAKNQAKMFQFMKSKKKGKRR